MTTSIAIRTELRCDCGGERVLRDGLLICLSCNHHLEALYDTPPKSNPKPETSRRNKYNNRKVDYEGRTFDSIAEAVRYWELKQLLTTGLISNLALQASFELVRGFVDWRGEKHRGVTYTPDFMYQTTRLQEWRMRERLTGATRPDPCDEAQTITVVEEVKGRRTRSYTLRLKLYLLKYPNIHFYEVPSAEVWGGSHAHLPAEIAQCL